MLKKYFIPYLSVILLLLMMISCGSDDDGGGSAELRDPQEVWVEDSLEIRSFLENYTYALEDNPINDNFQLIVFDSIGESNSNAEPIADSPLLESIEVLQDGVNYTMYILKIREGASSERHPKEVDSTLVTFRANTIENELFNSSPNPTWFDLVNEIRGSRLGLSQLRGSTGFTENSDGTITFNNDFGIGAIFVPSGLGYFSSPPVGTSLEAYQPLIVNFQLYKSIESDHDQDLVPSYLEDPDGNGLLRDNDTDRDGTPNYLDVDDDGDGTPTNEEVFIDENGELQIPDSNNDGTPDYLDENFPAN
jgi:hypothetical protein